MKIISLFLFLLLFSAQATVPCDLDKLLKGTYYHEELATSLTKLFDDFKQIDGEVLAGNKVPGWKEIEDLDQLLKKIELLNRRYQFPTEEDAKLFYQRVFAEHPEMISLFSKIKENGEVIIDADSKQLGHLELISFYREQVRRLEVFFPDTIKFQDLELERRRSELVAKGEEMVRKQEEFFKEMFKETEFVDFTTYQARLAEKKAELGEEALKSVQEGNFLISMRRPVSARWWVPKVGFQNQRITQSSRGTFDNRWRTQAEAILLGRELDEYSTLDWDLMPKYGFLESTDYKIGSQADYYGEDIFIFDPLKVQRRLSFTLRDSLGLGRVATNKIDNRFIPFENREVIVSTIWYEVLSGNAPASLLSLNADRYIEAQYFGPIRLDDVKSFVFTNTPPEGEFLQELLSRNIEILDKRGGGIPVKWTPPEVELENIEPILVSDFRPYELIGPAGKLTPIMRKASKGELPGSTAPKWFQDEKGVSWLLKDDQIHPELQTAAEVISSSIYKKLGFNVPETHIITHEGKRYAAIKSLGEGMEASNLQDLDTSEWREAYFIAALLKDSDRIYGANNNFKIGEGKFAMFDFGGSLGSKARGAHKDVWDGEKVFSPAVGYFENSQDIEVVFGRFHKRFKPEGHAWGKISKDDALRAVERLKTLSDQDIKEIVKAASYSNSKDEEYMIKALINRRDTMIECLANYFN